MKRLGILVLFVVPLALHAGTHSEFSYRSFLKARAIVDSALSALGAKQAPETIAYTLIGSYNFAGHFPEPGMRKTMHLRSHMVFNIRRGQLRSHDSLLSYSGRRYFRDRRVDAHKAYCLDYGDSEALPLHACKTMEFHVKAAHTNPLYMLQILSTHNSNMYYLGNTAIDGRDCHSVMITHAPAHSGVYYFDSRSHLLVKREILRHENLSGDYVVSTLYGDYRRHGSVMFARHITTLHDTTLIQEMRIADVVLNPAPEPEYFAMPPGYSMSPCEAPGTDSAAMAGDIDIDSLGRGVYLLALRKANSKTIVVEFDDHLAVIEAPGTSATGTALLAAINERISKKPVRYLLIGHHHPDYVGGIRAFIHHGATIVTTPGNREYIGQIARAPHRIAPDSLSYSQREPNFLLVEKQRTIGTETQRIQALDIGPESLHTKEYLVFYIPSLKLLFQGDLTHFPESGAVKPAGKRLINLDRIIREAGWDVELMIQSWPLAGAKRLVPYSTVEDMLELVPRTD